MAEIQPRNLSDADLASFYEENGKVYRRTSVTGEIKPSGLNTGGKVTEVTLDTSNWTALPTTALSDRNAICIQNKSGTEIKINYNNSVVGYVGIVISNGSERFYDITDDIIIYAKASSGTPTINIEEIA